MESINETQETPGAHIMRKVANLERMSTETAQKEHLKPLTAPAPCEARNVWHGWEGASANVKGESFLLNHDIVEHARRSPFSN